MGKSRAIENGWKSYRRDVMPANAIPVQVSECQMAFYAGAMVAHAAITKDISDRLGTPEDVHELSILLDLREEIEWYRRTYKLEHKI